MVHRFAAKSFTFLFSLAIVLTAFSFSSADDIGPNNKKIKVGTILGLSGNYAAYGQKMKKGIVFALQEADKIPSLPKIDLYIKNHEFQPAKAVLAYRQLVDVQGVKFILGITGSKNCLPVCAASSKDDVLILDPLGSAPKLTKHGGPNYFRIMASETFAGLFIIKWALSDGMKHPAIVYSQDDWGTSYKDTLLEDLHKRGFKDLAVFSITAGERNFRTQIQKLKRYKPDVIFLLVYAKEGSAYMQQIRQAGIDCRIYGTDNLSSGEFVSAGSNVVEGVRVALPALVEGDRYEEFKKHYRQEYGETPDANIIKSYDATMLLLTALKKYGPNPEKIKNWFLSPEFDYSGISGEIKFDRNGDLISQNYSFLIYHDGKLVPFKKNPSD